MIKETMAYLSQYDPEVGATIENEYHREQRNIELIASENIDELAKVRNQVILSCDFSIQHIRETCQTE